MTLLKLVLIDAFRDFGQKSTEKFAEQLQSTGVL